MTVPASVEARMPGVSVVRRWWWVGVLLVLGAAGAAWWSWQATPVPAVLATAQPLVRTLQFSARVETRSRVEVGSTVVGRVQSVEVREGDTVQAGQLLVQLETAALQAALRQAEARLVQAQAQARNVRSNSRISAQAQLAQTQASLQQAQADWDRHQQLVTQGFLSQAALDEKRKSLQVAQAQVQAAQAQARAAEEGGAQVQTAQAEIALAEAALAAARAQWEQARLVAPEAARVLVRAVEPGQIVQPGAALLQLALDGPMQIVAQVDERFLEQLREGQSAQVVADAFLGQPMAARVTRLAPGVDAQRGAIEVELALEASPPDFLREDMTLSVAVETGRANAALVLPLAALQGAQEGAEQAHVLVDVQGRATAQPVRVGLRTLEAAEIVEGLKPGTVVLLPPAQPGQRVRPQVAGRMAEAGAR